MTVRPDLNYPSVVIGTFVSEQLRMYSTLCVGVTAICHPGQNTGEGRGGNGAYYENRTE